MNAGPLTSAPDTTELPATGPTGPESDDAVASPPDPGRGGPGSGLADGPAAAWRRWRVPLALIAFILLGATVIAILLPAPRLNVYLDPASTSQAGTHALADILAERGHQVIGTYSPSAALTAVRPGHTTLVITSPGLLTGPQLARLSLAQADLVVVGPDRAVLAALSAGITVAGSPRVTNPVQAGCQLSAAVAAGDADMGGITFTISRARAGAVGCYRTAGHPSLVRYAVAGRVVTMLGTGLPLANHFLADQGNAALAINLLSTSHRIVWLTAQPAQAGAGPAGGSGSGPRLIPFAAYVVVLQLGIAVGLAALWRARRFGPLVPERLPVVVRASETVEGHARLYQSRRARDRAAAAIREAMLARVEPTLGLARGAPRNAVAEALASRSRLSQQEISTIIFGPPPASDAGLMALVSSLDELESEVRSQ
jgi:hypothetical protein